ncbi:hypothetical protein Bca52824_082892 [Brassica carinata]|uniref:No apical meristem-associated C-terminal domain-containing protein n=1 Tax=Brassica carinata TaxID=52824 RepID=A0A8X7TUQ6_BRACI|nr:hypothetical protein Bca52824_082892 [Brassica carinata]
MDSNPCSQNSKFVELLNSQQEMVFGFSQDSASKGQGKKKMAEGKPLSEFQTLWSIKKEDLAMKEKISKMKLLDSLIAKQEPLAEYEESLKKKLINDLLS